MRFSERPLAIIDLETSGLDPLIHEILDLAVLVVDQATLKVQTRYSARVRPTNIKRAAKRALAIVGYTDREWRTAVSLTAAMEVFSEKTRDAILCSTNIHLTRSFLDVAYQRCGVEDTTSYHHVDLMSMAWDRSADLGLARLTMAELSRKLNLESEPIPHRAAPGARAQLALLRAMKAQ
jgi:DNA polymerase III alpha subunit (gram-positive type)